ncbi:uncharacterized protein LOC114755993 [Neltuma alba]|uniref:uncharacterized protein LOC114755993 n=1 Tax=Neltuma alba TaxID=207710 RepID=UPI0010A3C42C|nr:uncharacterized protein LOC114755993 [Prosopis alba]
MHLESCTSEATQRELAKFANWILSIGDGTILTVKDTNDLITIPDDFLLTPVDNPLYCIVNAIYPNLPDHLQDKAYFNDRAILCPILSVVDEVNSFMLSLLPSEEVEYLSMDIISKQDTASSSIDNIHSIEFLNTIKMSGLPNHVLKLRVSAPVMVTQNIDKSNGLCNDTRLIVTRLEKHVIIYQMLYDTITSQSVMIPRITTPSDYGYPFTLCRHQFPLTLSFAMTINKS